MPRPISPLLGAVCALSLVACGSTVQQAGLTGGAAAADPAAAAGDGLGGPLPTVPQAEALPGADADPGGATTTRGSGPGTVDPGRVPGSAASVPAAPAPGRGGPAPAPDRDRRPVKVGVLYTNNDQGAASAGVDNGNTFTLRRVYEGVLKAYAARGGLGGRTIEPTYVELQSNSTSLAADLEAACTRFVQDAKVDVVLSTTGLFSEQFAECLARAGTPQLTGDYAFGDEQSLRGASTLFATAALTTDERLRALLEQLTAAGRLAPASRIGVVVEGCPFDTRTYERTVAPTAKRLGLSIVARADGRCFQSIGDLSGITTDMQAAVLRFQRERVDQVLFVSGSVEGNFMLFFATAAESQGYRPRYALTSGAVLAVQEANTPRQQLTNAAGIGWIPAIDTVRATPPLPAGRRCLADLQAGSGATPQSPLDRYYALSVCSGVALYDTALRASSGAADRAAVSAAVTGTGTSFAAAVVQGERTDFRRGRRTGPAEGRVFSWGSCGCFEYVGKPFPLTRQEAS